MRRGAKPAKAKVEANLPAARKSRKSEGSTVHDLEKRLAEALKREAEAQEQQTATAEILRVISQSPTDVQPVFEAIARSAARLCDAIDASIHRLDGARLRVVAHHGPIPLLQTVLDEGWLLDAGSVTGRAILERRRIHVEDLASADEFPLGRDYARRLGHRTTLAVPLLRQGTAIGGIVVRREEIRPFTDSQMELLETFADQAVIAIENVRLFKELQEKNRALTHAHAQVTEALEQQTATAEVLKVISRSTFDLQPVLDTLIENAARLCTSQRGAIMRRDGDSYHGVAFYNVSPELTDFIKRHPITPGRHSITARVALERRTIHVEDLQADPEYRYALRDADPIRTELGVPIFRGDDIVGVIILHKLEVQPFTDKQIELVETFADQAVIAIENVRLFSELQAKNADLTEALEQQTATSEILRVISSSPTDVQPTFEAIAASATRLCVAGEGTLFRFDGRLIHLAAHCGLVQNNLVRSVFPRPPGPGSVTARAILTRSVVHIPDVTVDPDLERSVLITAGFRTVLSVPMLRDGDPIGAITVSRQTVAPFSDAQIALLHTFADQAVIAIENVRLFTELQEKNRALTQAHAQVSEALDQQTATSEILRVISGSPTDVQPVFDAIAASATRLCEADFSGLYQFDGTLIHFSAQHGRTPEEIEAARQTFPQPLGRASVSARAILDASVVQVGDVREDLEIADALRALFRTVMAVPMMRDGRPIGTITVARRVVRPFSDEQIALLKTFADQAVIAIENVRLFRELEVANRELAAASQHKSEFLANMSHELRTPLNAIIGFSEVLTERMFGELNEKQEEYLNDIHASGTHLLSLINDILDLSKIEAGRMELELTDFDLPTALDSALTLVRERAGRRGIRLESTIDERLGQVRADERKIRQVVLNLLSNAIKFTPEGGRIEVRAVPVDGSVEVSVSDTGVGIAPEDQEAVFEEFRQVGTSAAKQEGTGLGLTLCRKFVELHGGRIWVKSQVGVGSTFTFTIPVRRGE